MAIFQVKIFECSGLGGCKVIFALLPAQGNSSSSRNLARGQAHLSQAQNVRAKQLCLGFIAGFTPVVRTFHVMHFDYQEVATDAACAEA